MKKTYTVHPADLRLAHIADYQETFTSLEAAEDRVAELFDLGVFYDITAN
jgi:hypothetical protein